MIYHITTAAQWEAAQASGSYEVESLKTEGFIHFSQAGQVTWVANTHYAGQSGLVLLHIDPARLTADLRYEPPDKALPEGHAAAGLFPHLYGPLNAEAVVNVTDFTADASGTFRFMEG